MNLQQFIVYTLSDGGCTHSLNNVSTPTTGYFAAMYGREKLIPKARFKQDVLSSYIRDNVEVLSNDDKYLGSWIDEDGMVCLDVSVHFDSLRAALEFGIRHKQKAIWDVVNEKEILLPYHNGHNTDYQWQSYCRQWVNKQCETSAEIFGI